LVYRPRAELMRKAGWRTLSGTLAVLGVASALAFHWVAALSWLAMALFCLLKEFKEPSETVPMSGGGPGYFKIGTLRGTAIFGHWSIPFTGFLISAFVGFNFLEAIYYSAGCLCVIALHESAHALVARRIGLKVLSVQISGISGRCWIE